MTNNNGQGTRDELTGGSQGNGRTTATQTQSPEADSLAPKFAREQAVVLKQSPLWSQAIVWGIIGVTTASIIWACVAKIEQVIPARGQLKPQGTVKEIQAPVNGVVEEVLVENGDHVKKGQVLVKMDSTASAAELTSFKKIRSAALQESEFYRTVMERDLDPAEVERAIARLNIPKAKATLVRNRTELLAETRMYQVQLGSAGVRGKLSSQELARVRAANAESDSRAAAARLETAQLEKQLQQNQGQLADARKQLIEDRKVLAEIRQRNIQAREEGEKTLKIDEEILDTVQPLMEEGALAKLQVERQKQSIYERRQQLIEQQANGTIEYDKQGQQIQDRRTEIERLQKEERRLRYLIEQARERFTNTVVMTEKDIRDKMAANDQRLAEIDTQLTRILLDNEKRVAELDSQISRSQVTLKYQELKAPVGGTVFDLKASPGFVPPTAQAAQADPLLKIVPDDYLIAEVNITNQDIGFVRRGMKTDVRIDSFPYSEFGEIKGKVSWIGSDALKPDEIEKYYRFPAKIELESQTLNTGGRKIPLQSGMSVTANIKVREKRTVMSLFWEMFTNKMESLEQVR